MFVSLYLFYFKQFHQKDHSTVVWAWWRRNTTAHRGPAPRCCIGPRIS